MSARFHSLLSLGKHACIQNAAKLDESLHRLLNNPDAEAVHDVRVACRRLGVALRIVEPLYQRRNLRPLAKKIKALMKALSEVRDTEVLSERARAIGTPANGKPAKVLPSVSGAARLADLLDAQIELGRLAGAAFASHAGYSHLPRQIHESVQALGLDKQKLQNFPLIRLPQFAGVVLQGLLTPISAKGITRASSSDDLHELRILFKKLRYAAEFFAEGLPTQRIHPLIKCAQLYQKILGDLHDADVALEMFRAWHAVRHKESAPRDARTARDKAVRTGYETIQAGLGKLIACARADSHALREKFFSVWTLRHQRVLARLVAEVSQPLMKSRSTISRRS